MIDSPDDVPPRSPTASPRRRRRTGRRILLAILLIVILVPVAAAVAAFLTFDPNAYKAQIVAAVRQATGREVTLAGPLAVKLAWVPTITAKDVRLANVPGAAAPDMAQIAEIETRIALLPMLHHRLEIRDLVLRHPSVVLERTADGRPNWLFQPATPTGGAPAQPVTVKTAGSSWAVAIDSLEIIDGRFTYRNDGTGKAVTFAVSHADLAAQRSGDTPPATSPMAVSLAAIWQGVPVTLTGTTGPIAHLTDPMDRSPWPVHLVLAAVGASVTTDGTVTDPREASGYALALHATVPALEALNPLLPTGLAPLPVSLPPIHGLTLAANLAQPGEDMPSITNLSVQAQQSDLGAMLPGLRLDSLSLITPALDQPATVDILGERSGLAFTLSGSVGPLAPLLASPAPKTPSPETPPTNTTVPAAPPAPLPVDLVLTAAHSNLHLQGAIADPLTLRGLHLGIAAQIADLGPLSPLAGAALPHVTNLSGTGVLSDAPQGLAQGLRLTALDLTAPQGDLEGAGAVDYAGRTTITAELRSAHLDVDALLALAAKPATASAPAPATTPNALPAPPPPAAASPQSAAAKRRVIPDLPLPIAGLRSFDARVSLAFASLRLGGADYRALVTQISLVRGLLSLSPSSVVIPGGELVAAGQLDARGATPNANLSMQAPNLAIAPLLAALHLPVSATGFVQVFANLTGSGGTTQALAESLSGAVGLAAVNGTIDGSSLGALIRPAVHAARVIPPELLDAAGKIPLHCLALRIDSANGVGSVRALVLDTSALLLQGSGSLNFGQESLALALQPDLYLGGTEISAPLTLGGSFADPRLGKVGSVVINARPTGGEGLNGLFRSLVGGGHKAPPVAPACNAALALARNGQPGPAPDGGNAGVLGKPINLLQQLLHGQ